MKRYFDNLRQVESSEFFRKFQQHTEERLQIDVMERQILQKLWDSKELHYYCGTLNKIGNDNLILPHHAVELKPGRDPDRPVKKGGEKFGTVIEDYRKNYMRNSRFPECAQKIRDQNERFFSNPASVLEADFLFVCNVKDDAHPGDHYDDSHGGSRIYIGKGFHRFVAYGLWIADNEFGPLSLYYVERQW